MARREIFFFHLELEQAALELSYTEAPLLPPAGLFPCPGGLGVEVPQECMVELKVAVRAVHFVSDHSCALWASAFPRCVLRGRYPMCKEWERCCLQRSSRWGVERSTVIVGRLWFLYSHCPGSCEANVKK